MDDLLEVQAVGGVRLAADAPHAQLVGRALEESLSGAQCKVEVLAKGAEGDVVGLNGAHIGAGQVVALAGGHGLVLQLAVVGVLAEILFHVMRRQGGIELWTLADAAPPPLPQAVLVVVQQLDELIVGHCVMGVHVED